jgi:positive regulator of sigma E activity
VGNPALTERERRIAVPSSQNDALSHAMAMVVTPLLMGLFGAWLDRRLGTGWVFAALFATLGVIGAVASAYYRYEARMAEHDAGKPWTRRARQADEGVS